MGRESTQRGYHRQGQRGQRGFQVSVSPRGSRAHPEHSPSARKHLSTCRTPVPRHGQICSPPGDRHRSLLQEPRLPGNTAAAGCVGLKQAPWDPARFLLPPQGGSASRLAPGTSMWRPPGSQLPCLPGGEAGVCPALRTRKAFITDAGTRAPRPWRLQSHVAVGQEGDAGLGGARGGVAASWLPSRCTRRAAIFPGSGQTELHGVSPPTPRGCHGEGLGRGSSAAPAPPSVS